MTLTTSVFLPSAVISKYDLSSGATATTKIVLSKAKALDPNLAIYHYGNDVFKVRTMSYTFNGCTKGDQIDLGTFDNIYDAQDCAEDYLKDLLLDLGV